MREFLDRISTFSPKRLALLAAELNARVQELEQAAREPIAIVGVGCRFPGAWDEASYWRLLRNGVDAIAEVPPDRWNIADYYDPDPDVPGKMSTRFGGFVSGIDRFDPQFFGIAPREAETMDPQQRLLLEVAWEALEHAGIAADGVEGSNTGVFIGMSANDYFHLIRARGLDRFDAYTASGTAHSIASGRLSYVLGLCGPSVSIDTACSSSLVAVHQAVQSLRRGESDMALAGGVNLILGPDISIALSKSRMMAPDGRCKAFDARADGFVRGEGCGIVVLKRLSDATASGDRILALIRGSAINQDGRSNGLTAPNGPSQEDVLRGALADADLMPDRVDYVEAHGTGTSLGDPIEIQALGAVIGPFRSKSDPLLVGSVKTNIGHLEAAAGVAGLIKVALALHHEELPAQLHLQEPNPFIPWEDLPVEVVTHNRPWLREAGQSRFAGVSSFGFSGTNAHLILEQAPTPALPVASAPERPVHLLAFSARDDVALSQLAGRYRDALRQGDASLADIAYSANTGRSHFNWRLTLRAADHEAAAEALDQQLVGGSGPGLDIGEVTSTRQPRIAFLFTGQGSQYAGMGRTLYRDEPVFRAVIDRCAAVLDPLLPMPLLAVLDPPDGTPSPIDDTLYTQPALFAVELALAELWQSWGVRPSVVMGHSVGEIVAACVAGVFSVEDALTLVAARGRLMAALPRNGAMVAIQADEAWVRDLIALHTVDVSIAAINGPSSVVISGLATTVDVLARRCEESGVKATRLTVSHAFHSPLLDRMLDAFETAAGSVTYRPPAIELVSNLTGELAGSEVTTARYWRDHARGAVRFGPAIAGLQRAGVEIFLELGPSPTLVGMGKLSDPDEHSLWMPSLRKGRNDWDQMLESLAAIYRAGVDVAWEGLDRDRPRRRITLPSYQFQRERYWVDSPRVPLTVRPTIHPLLGCEVVQAATPQRIFETVISVEGLPYLDDHRIAGVTLLPSPAYVEMALTAARVVLGTDAVCVRDLVVHRPLDVGEGETTVQVVVDPPSDGRTPFTIYGRDSVAAAWFAVANGVMSAASGQSISGDDGDWASMRARVSEPVDMDSYYGWLTGLGLDFGPRFRGAVDAQRRDGEVIGRIEAPPGLGDVSGYRLHPALLDSCLHLIGAAVPDATATVRDPFFLLGADRIEVIRAPGASFQCQVRVRPDHVADLVTRETFTVDVRLIADDGSVHALLEGLQLKRAGVAAGVRSGLSSQVQQLLYQVVWRRAAADAAPVDPHELVRAVEPLVADQSRAQGFDRFADFQPVLDGLATAYIVQAFQRLGWDFGPGAAFTEAELAERLRVVPGQRSLFRRLLAILAEDRILTAADAGWRVTHVPPVVDAEREWQRVAPDYPEFDAELALTRRCAQELAEVLRGEADPLQLLFPGGSLADTERLYQNSPASRTYNSVLAALVERIPGGTSTRPFRVLEIGAGTGGTTSYVLPVLAKRPGLEYTYTDVSPLFLNKAREKFGAYQQVEYRTLDIGRSPAEQGFEPDRYDLILGTNVIHATADLAVTMGHVYQLLAPGGLVALLEGTAPQRFGDLTVGMTDGWWAFTDTGRRQYALMPHGAWLDLLSETGFTGAAALPGADAGPVLSQQAIFVAQRAPIAARPAQGDWIIVPDRGGVAELVAAGLRERGESAVIVPDPLHVELRAALAVRQGGQPVRGVLYLPALDIRLAEGTSADELALTQQTVLGGALEVIHAAAATGAVTGLWLVTRGAQATREGEAADPAQATLWGMGHVIAMEHPELNCIRFDLDPAAQTSQQAEALLASLDRRTPEDQIAVRDGGVWCRRLVRNADARVEATRTELAPDATYLVTGGLRGLGLRVAEWLVDRGARHLALMGRRAPGPEAEVAIARMEAHGASIRILQGDVGRREDAERTLGEIRRVMPPLRGVVHAAGVLDDGVLTQQTWPRFETVLGPKVQGTWHLHQLAGDLDFLVLFSSGASVAGSVGQANHAAANSFEDMLAYHRQAQGQPTVSINWGPWAEIGAAADRQITARDFMGSIRPADGLTVLEWAMRRQNPGGLFLASQVAVLPADWERFLATYPDGAVPPLVAELAEEVARRRVVTRQAPAASRLVEGGLRQRILDTVPNRRLVVLRDFVRDQAVKVLGAERRERFDLSRPLRELGLDSLMAVELRNKLGTGVGRTLPATLTFDCPTAESLVEYLAAEVFHDELAARKESPSPDAGEPPPDDGVTLDGLSADDLASLLEARLDGIASRKGTA